jgi:hypothetical protein
MTCTGWLLRLLEELGRINKRVNDILAESNMPPLVSTELQKFVERTKKFAEDWSKSAPQSVALLGKTGVGKSFLMSIQCSAKHSLLDRYNCQNHL